MQPMLTRCCAMMAAMSLCALCSFESLAGTTPLGSAFKYQGVFEQSGSPYGGTADFQFSLWEVAAGGPPVGSTLTIPGVTVTEGVFSATLDFGTLAFTGSERWLEIAVRAPAGIGSYTTLSPRQRIDAAPYALFALNANTPFVYNGGNAVFTGGNVGIGTTSPTASLDVLNPSLAPGAAAIKGTLTSTIGGNSNAGVRGVNQSTVAGWGVWGSSSAGGSGAGVKGDGLIGVWGEASGSSGWNAGVVGITSSPNGFAGVFYGRGNFTDNLLVGVGNPGARLHAKKGGSGVSGYLINDITVLVESDTHNLINMIAPDNMESGVSFGRPNGPGPTNTSASLAYNNASTLDGLQFRTGGNLNRMTINSAGNVGLGFNNTNAMARLDVYNEQDTNLINTAQFRTAVGGANISHIHHGAGGDWYIRSANNGGKVVIQDTLGNVGIGTSAPGTKLHIVNDNAAMNSLQSVNSAAAGSNVGSGVVGITAQASVLTAGVRGHNAHAQGTGVIGTGSGAVPSGLGAGSGGAFTGNVTGVAAFSTTGGVGEGLYANQFGSVVRVAYWNGSTFFKINGTGTVSTIVRDVDDKPVTMFAPESPECLLQDFGEGMLINGFAHIDLDPNFAKNVLVDPNHPLRVFIQLEGDENCQGVVVKNKTATGFDVVELRGGRSNTPFQYQITCNRADETLPDGRVSHYADLRFPAAKEPSAIETGAAGEAGSAVAQLVDQPSVRP